MLHQLGNNISSYVAREWHAKHKRQNLPPAEAAVARASIVLPVPKCREKVRGISI